MHKNLFLSRHWHGVNLHAQNINFDKLQIRLGSLKTNESTCDGMAVPVM